ncbi:MAG: PAS domain-containing protein, partial [Planctomycetes bacterium]|nr:PAS domain-containing protein [Planctomycetota bacterium]
MYADRDLKIQYLNPASVKQLKQFEGLLPVKVEQIVGQSIDIFHQRPAPTREILSDPKNLPHRAIIQIGPEKLKLAAYALRDADGQYIGPMVAWDVVTEELKLQEKNKDYASQIAAISKSQAVVELDLDGAVITANDNFLAALGHTLDEIKGRHHSMFVEERFRHSPEYKEFWARLARGEHQTGEFKRIARTG